MNPSSTRPLQEASSLRLVPRGNTFLRSRKYFSLAASSHVRHPAVTTHVIPLPVQHLSLCRTSGTGPPWGNRRLQAPGIRGSFPPSACTMSVSIPKLKWWPKKIHRQVHFKMPQERGAKCGAWIVGPPNLCGGVHTELNSIHFVREIWTGSVMIIWHARFPVEWTAIRVLHKMPLI